MKNIKEKISSFQMDFTLWITDINDQPSNSIKEKNNGWKYENSKIGNKHVREKFTLSNFRWKISEKWQPAYQHMFYIFCKFVNIE